MVHATIGLGANQIAPSDAILNAVSRLEARPKVTLIRRSEIIQSRAVTPHQQPDYCNAAALIETELSPHELLAELLSIEAELGRVRQERWGARQIDLDLLLYDDLVCHTPELTLPHPWMTVRQFVLGPAASVFPMGRHPIADRTLSQLLPHLSRPIVSVVDARRLSPNSSPTLARSAREQFEEVGEHLAAGGHWIADPAVQEHPLTVTEARSRVVAERLGGLAENRQSVSKKKIGAPFLVANEFLAGIILIAEPDCLLEKTSAERQFLADRGAPCLVLSRETTKPAPLKNTAAQIEFALAAMQA